MSGQQVCLHYCGNHRHLQQNWPWILTLHPHNTPLYNGFVYNMVLAWLHCLYNIHSMLKTLIITPFCYNTDFTVDQCSNCWGYQGSEPSLLWISIWLSSDPYISIWPSCEPPLPSTTAKNSGQRLPDLPLNLGQFEHCHVPQNQHYNEVLVYLCSINLQDFQENESKFEGMTFVILFNYIYKKFQIHENNSPSL